MKVFLSYRRSDDRHLAGRLRDVLARELGDDNVFFDVDSITAGEDFRVAIREYIDDTDVMIALIGSRWDPQRLSVATDVVRTEITEALQDGTPVIPVLIEDTPMPGPDELPEDMAGLAYINALVVRPDPDFHADADRVLRAAHDAEKRAIALRQRMAVDREEEARAEEARRLAAAVAAAAAAPGATAQPRADVSAAPEVPAAPPEERAPAPPRRALPPRLLLWLAAGAIALAGLIVVLVLVSGGDDDPQGAPSDSTSASTDPGSSVDTSTSPSSTAGSAELGPFAATTHCTTARLPLDLVVVDTDVWITSAETGLLQRCGASAGGSPAESFSLGPPPSGATGHEILSLPGLLYVTQHASGSVARVDLSDMSVEPIPVDGAPFSAALIGETVWVVAGDRDDLLRPGRVMPIDGTETGPAIELPIAPGYMRAIGGQLWIASFWDNKLGRVDPVTGDVVEFDMPGEPIDLLSVGDHLWVTLRSAGQVAVIDPESGEILDRIDVGPRPHMLIEAFGSVWVSTEGDQYTPASVTRIDPETRLNVQRPIELSGLPLSLSAGQDRLYVAHFMEDRVSVLEPES